MIQKHKYVTPLVQKTAQWQEEFLLEEIQSSPRTTTPKVQLEKLWWKKEKLISWRPYSPCYISLLFQKCVHCQLEFRLCLHAWPLESLCTVSHSVIQVSEWLKWLPWSFLWPVLWSCYSFGPDLRHTFWFIVPYMPYKEMYVNNSYIWITSLNVGYLYMSEFTLIALFFWPSCWEKWLL